MSRNKYKEKAMSAVNKLKSNLKGKLYEMADIPSVSVKQLSEFIQQHPDTQITKRAAWKHLHFLPAKCE